MQNNVMQYTAQYTFEELPLTVPTCGVN